jgi:uncharacterized membrane protein YfcA
MLSTVIAAVAIIVFVAGGVVAWPQALVMIPGVALGGWSGVWVAKRVPQSVMRALVITVGLFLAVYYFVTVDVVLIDYPSKDDLSDATLPG